MLENKKLITLAVLITIIIGAAGLLIYKQESRKKELNLQKEAIINMSNEDSEAFDKFLFANTPKIKHTYTLSNGKNVTLEFPATMSTPSTEFVEKYIYKNNP